MAFCLWPLYSGSLEVLRFSDSFSEFLSKCVYEHSRNQFYQSYWAGNSRQFLSVTQICNVDIPKLIKTSSYKLVSFPPIFVFFIFFSKNIQVARTSAVNVRLGSILFTQSYIKLSTLQFAVFPAQTIG